MRSARFVAVLLASLVASQSTAFAQDFDPHGRKKPPAGVKPGGKPAGKPSGKPGPVPSGKPSGTPNAATEEHGTAAAVLIERYTKIVLAQVGSPFPLQRLAQLYRERDGKLTALVGDFEKRAAVSSAEQYAAIVALAGVYKIDGRADESIATYERAIAMKDKDASAILALARLLQDRGDVAPARKRYEQALDLQTTPQDKEQTVRTLLTLALDGKDWAGAKNYHERLVKMQPTSLFVKGELGRELYTRGEYERAEAELIPLVAAAAGDNRALAPALKDLGKAQAKAHKNKEAIATLKKGLQAAGAEAAVRAEIYETIAEIYRADGQLGILVKQLEDEHPTDFPRLALLGALYEETGDLEKALGAYKRALAVNPRHIDLRLKVIRVLQAQGELDKAIAEYEGLIRAAPNNPNFVFEQCDALLQRGDRARALKLLAELEGRGGTDEDVLSRLADFYGRIGESEKSLRVLTRLTQVGATDPAHLVDLGDRYFQDGNKELAVQTWKRILVTVQPRARALSALGDVYLEHEMLNDALSVLREAVVLEPASLPHKKQLATALERTRNYKEARLIWTELAEKARVANDRVLAREARTRLVSLWGMEKMLEGQSPVLAAKFAAVPPDLEAGRTLAEVQIHLRKIGEAELTLRRVTELAPGDPDGYLALERVLVQETKLEQAIVVLEKLVAVDPKRARELYQRMAQYALQLYKDDDAIKYAARAVELNPDDAEGHRRLGDMYRSRQDSARAILEYRAAIQKNDRLFLVYLQLADLLLSNGQTDEADRLFRRVLRGAPDEELVSRAARLSMQINLGKGTLESLEQELLPLAIGNPQRPIYRRLLVETYGNLTFSLVSRVKHADPKDASDAKEKLAKIGARAVKPLVDALADSDAGQQRIAIDVLSYVENKNASPALFAFATGQGDTLLRSRAMIACGMLRDPNLVPKIEGLLFPKADASGTVLATDGTSTAAAWALARIGGPRAVTVMKRLLDQGTPEMRALAALGLAQAKDKKSAKALAEVAKSPDAGAVARAGAAYALGILGEQEEAGTLLALSSQGDPLGRQLATLGLGRLYAGKGRTKDAAPAVQAMADALFAPSNDGRTRGARERLADAGAFALVLASGKGSLPRGDSTSELPTLDERLDVEAALGDMVPTTISTEQRAEATLVFARELKRAAVAATQVSDERARSVLDALGPRGNALAPLVLSTDPEDSPGREMARGIAKEIEPNLVALTRHPDVALRTKALTLVARSSSEAARAATAAAIREAQPEVQRIALAAVGGEADSSLLSATESVATTSPDWALRSLAVEALGRFGKNGAAARATPILARIAENDAFAIVREAALLATARYDLNAAKALATQLSKRDGEPHVRETAARILRGEPR